MPSADGALGMTARSGSMTARARAIHARTAPYLAVLATLLLALAAWLSLPRSEQGGVPTRPPLRALLVDLSASVTRCRPDHSAWLREALLSTGREARAAGEELLVVAYAADVETVYGPAPAAGFEDLLLGRGGPIWHPRAGAGGDLASDLCAALRLARAELCSPGRAAARLELYGDGGASDGEPREELEALARAGVSVRTIELPPRTRTDIAIAGLVAPRELESGAPLALTVELELEPGSAAWRTGGIELDLELEGAGRSTSTTRTLALPSGVEAGADGRVHWSARVELGVIDPGLWNIRLEARWIDAEGRKGDPVPENDASATRVRVDGSLVGLLVCSPEVESASAAWLVHDGRIPGFEAVPAAPEDLPGRLADVDLLITIDLGPADLPGSAIASFVRRGGGWLALDGWRALDGGGVVRDLVPGAAADLLPLLADPGAASERDVLLVVDGSGSMEGEPFDRVREAVHELVLTAAPRDRLELRFFTAALGPSALDSPRGSSTEERAAAANALFAARVPGGATDVLQALEELALLRRAESTPALVILITDGHTSHATAERAQAARRSLASSGADLRVIAIGADADEAFLETLLLQGERLARSRDLVDLRELLAREMNADRVRSGPGLAALLAAPIATSSPLARDLGQAWRSAFDPPRAIERYERARAAPQAEVLWITGEGEPLLALQRVGQGLVAACTGSPESDWTPFLAREPEVLAPLLSALGRGNRERASPPLEIAFERDELILSAVPLDWPAVVQATIRSAALAGVIREPSAELGELTLTVPTRGVGRDPLDLRTGRLPPSMEDALPAGTYVEIELRGAGVHEVLGMLAPLPPELRRPASRRLFAGLPAPDSETAAPGRSPHPVAAPLLGLGLVLLFLAGVSLGGGDQGTKRSSRN